MVQKEVLEPYFYELPKDRIAQRPCHPADHAKMLVVDRKTGQIFDSRFADLPGQLTCNDLLVFNDTRVIPARLFGTLDTDGGGAIELLLVERLADNRWVCIGRPLRKIRSAGRIRLSDTLVGEVAPESSEPDKVTVEFHTTNNESVAEALINHGSMPIPPYIRGGRGDELDEVDYQTIFAREPGSVAAPTASLHFNEELVGRIRSEAGCSIGQITLHVGTASFQPVLDNGVLKSPSAERCNVSRAVINQVATTKRAGGRVIGVGTTSVRALEGEATTPLAERTDLFITPGYTFRRIDALITNFHQPGTTHLLLVEALLGRALLVEVYRHALANNYRFLSYGDGMFIV